MLTFSFSASVTPSENIYNISLFVQHWAYNSGAVSHNTVTRLKVGWCTVQIMAGTRHFSSPNHADRLWGPTQAPVQQTLGAPSPGLKQPDHEIEHLIPSSVRLRMSGTTPPLPLYMLLHDSVYLCYLVYCSRCQHFQQDVQFELQMNTLTTVNF